jgi:cytochrome P450 family 110
LLRDQKDLYNMTTAIFNEDILFRQPLRLNPIQQWKYFSQPRATYDWFCEHYSDLVPLHFQGQDYAFVLTPRVVREVFAADPDGYIAFWHDSFAGMNGEGSLWVLAGERHRRERQLFAPAVHANHFRAYGETIRGIVRDHLKSWQTGRSIRAIETTLNISLDVIMRLVFGVVDNELLRDGRVVISALTHSAHPLIVFFPKMQRSWFPLWRRYARTKKELYAWFDSVLAERRARADGVGDVLGVLMTARDEDGQPFTDEHIKNELLSVLTAGHITTSVALAWSLYELVRHPEVLKKLRAELEGFGETPDPGLLVSLPYLSAVVNETIRLHPILSECARVPTAPINIHGHTIRAGQALVISIVGIHHNPTIYPEPDRFLPERFIENKFSNFEFLPFGGGHRRCLGAGLAEYTLRIALAEIATSWDLQPAGLDIDIRHDIAMGPKYGAPVRINSRRNPH